MASLEGLSFNIGVNVDKGQSNNINALAKSLNALSDAVSKMSDKASEFSAIGSAIEALDKVNTKGIEKIADSIAKLNDSSKGLKSLKTAMNGLKFDDSAAGNVEKAVDGIMSALEKLDSVSKESVENVEKIGNAFSNIKISDNAMGNVVAFGTYLKVTMESVSNISDEAIAKLERIGDALSKIPVTVNLGRMLKTVSESGVLNAARDAGAEASGSKSGASESNNDRVPGAAELPRGLQMAISGFGRLNDIGGKVLGFLSNKMIEFGKNAVMSPVKSIGNLIAKFGQLRSSIGRILMYRAIRTVLSEISKGIGEGIKNLYQWSAVANGVFKSSMDGLASSSQYLGNSIAAMASPLINAIEPVVMRLVDDFVLLLNVVNQVFAALGGGSTFTLAKRTAKEYADTVGKAAGGASGAAKELKRTILGFDELNVLNDNNKSGGGGGGGAGGINYSDMFETQEVSTGVKNWVDAIKEAFATNSGWEAIGAEFGKKFNGIVESIDTGELGAKVGTVINGAVGIAYGFLDATNFIRIGEKISDFFNNALEKINFRNVGGLLVAKFTSLLDTAIGIVTTLDWGLIGRSISDLINGALSQFGTWLGNTDWGALGVSLAKGLGDIIANIDIGEMIGNLITIFVNIGLGIGEFLWGFGATLGRMIVDGLTSGSIVNTLKEWLISGLSKINELAKKFGIDLHLDAFIEDVKSSLDEDDVRKEMGADDVTAFLTGTTVGKKVAMNDLFAPGTLDPNLKIKPVIDDPVWKNQGFDQWAGISGHHTANINAKLTTPVGGPTTLDKAMGTDKIYNTKTTLTLTNSSGTSLSTASALGTDKTQNAKSTLGLVNGAGASTSTASALGLNSTFTANTALGMMLSGGSLTTNAQKWLGLDKTYTVNVKTKLYDSSITGGNHQALGGVYNNGKWSSIPQFAGGGAIRGSHFIAGEAGAELVGHIGGRSEVLNASQLASIMYRSVVGGMTATSGFWESMNSTMIDCTNGAIRAMYDNDSDKGNEEEISLLRRQNEILTRILEKDVVASVSIDDINTAQRRRSLRTGAAMA